MERNCPGLSSSSFATISVEPVVPDCRIGLIAGKHFSHFPQRSFVTVQVHPFIISRFQNGIFYRDISAQCIIPSTRVQIDQCSSVRGNTCDACSRMCLFDSKQENKAKQAVHITLPRQKFFLSSIVKVLAGSFCGENSEPARYIYETVNFIDIVSFVRFY